MLFIFVRLFYFKFSFIILNLYLKVLTVYKIHNYFQIIFLSKLNFKHFIVTNLLLILIHLINFYLNYFLQ